MTVMKNITAAPRKVLRASRKEAEANAMRLLERFGLADKAPMYPDSLSGGQQQRAAIVRALAMDPILLLLDEVTSALDPELTGEVLDVIRQLAAEGMTLILATHELEFARAIAKKICFMWEGVIFEEGSPAEMLDNPKHSRTRTFVSRLAKEKE
jgi:polar amino acid transport system ATP-binding protein